MTESREFHPIVREILESIELRQPASESRIDAAELLKFRIRLDNADIESCFQLVVLWERLSQSGLMLAAEQLLSLGRPALDRIYRDRIHHKLKASLQTASLSAKLTTGGQQHPRLALLSFSAPRK